MVDHAATEHQELDLRDSLDDPDRHRLLRCDVPPGPRRVQRASRRSTSTTCRSSRLPATGSTPSGCCRPPTSPTARGCKTPGSAHATALIPSRHSRSMRRPRRSTERNELRAAHRFRASLQRRVLGVRPRRARVPHPDVDERVAIRSCVRRLLHAAPAEFPVEDPDIARRRRRLSDQGRSVPDANEHLQHGPRERDPFQSRGLLQHQSRSDPPLWRRDRASLRLSDTLLLRGGAAYTRAVFRDGPFTGNDVPLVSRYTASGGVTWNVWERYLVVDATMRDWSEPLHGQRSGQSPQPADSCERHRRFQAERRISSASSGR